MQNLTLYPSDKNNKLGIFYGFASLAFGGYLVFLNGDSQFMFLGYFAVAGGGWTAARAMLQRSNPRPVFQADANGFSVKGKAKRPWSEYRGVRVYNGSSGLFSIAKMVRVRVGTSIFEGYIQINPLQLSDTAQVMAMQIERFAETVKSSALVAKVDTYPVLPVVAQNGARPAHHNTPALDFGTPTQQLTFAQRLHAGDGGPVKSTPRLSERIFGRRKVI